MPPEALAIGAFALADDTPKQCESSPPGHLLGVLSFQSAHIAQHYKRLYPNTQAHCSYQPREALFIHPPPCRLWSVPKPTPPPARTYATRFLLTLSTANSAS